MNLLVSQNLAAVTPDRLPPAQREGPARVLFLSSNSLGWKTNGQQLIRATERRDDIAAVHILLTPPLWMKVLNRRVPGVGEHMVHPMTTWQWVIGRWLRGPLAVGRFDAVHANPQTLAAAVVADKGGLKLSIATDTTDRQFHRDLMHDAGGKHDNGGDGAIFRAADVIAPWSQWCADSLTSDYGIDPAKLVITPPVIYSPPAGPRSGRGDRPRRIGFIGNDWVRKGGPRLLAWHQARWAGRGVELHVASADAAGFAPAVNVTWHGRLDAAGVLAMLDRVDLLVHPTTRDMSAIVVAEAGTRGVPAVASRIAGIPDLIEDRISGVLIDPADDGGFIAAVERILFDDAVLSAMSAAAQNRMNTTLHPDTVYGRLLDRIVAACRIPLAGAIKQE